MAVECFEAITKIANDREMSTRGFMNNSESKQLLEQLVNMLEIFNWATKQWESDNSATASKIIPIVLNILLELENPEVLVDFDRSCLILI